ncbi:palmitoyl-protein thioesterase ABHD10, mitochondrial-like [Branchiostoma lanceolatum]|uniref:palmitoyl-protein thioesterase ABHD10, mitochondrial-like n=1 Tax=Branchiostoma lanceolatum TaxID=7740 RepID=UPI003456BDE7
MALAARNKISFLRFSRLPGLSRSLSTSPDLAGVQYLVRGHDPDLAYCSTPGRSPGVIFFPGFLSSMDGTKALALEGYCRAAGLAYTRFDYRGMGLSQGSIENCSINTWKQDCLDVLDRLTTGKQIIVGSSMGGWLMLLIAMNRPERLHALVGIATAADFVKKHWEQAPIIVQNQWREKGVYTFPSDYTDTGTVSLGYGWIQDSLPYCILGTRMPISCPVRLIHGLRDQDVPYQTSAQILEELDAKDVDLILRKSGDHRMSEPEDLELIIDTVDKLVNTLGEGGGGREPDNVQGAQSVEEERGAITGPDSRQG